MKNFDKFLNNEIIYEVKNSEDMKIIIKLINDRLKEKFDNSQAWSDTDDVNFDNDDVCMEMYNGFLTYGYKDEYEYRDTPIIQFTRPIPTPKEQVALCSVVKFRNGELRYVVNDANGLALMGKSDHISMSFYSDDMIHSQNNHYDVIAIAEFESQASAIYNVSNNHSSITWMWERPLPTNYEMICQDQNKLLEILLYIISVACYGKVCLNCQLRECCEKKDIVKYLNSPEISLSDYIAKIRG